MYSSYSFPAAGANWPRRVITDTQSTYLLVYAPGRTAAFCAPGPCRTSSTANSGWRIPSGSARLTEGVDGVLLVSEDVACLSTTLTYFAQALRDGADYAVCNAVFGFSEAVTALYQSHGPIWPRVKLRPRQPPPAGALPRRRARTPKASRSCWRWPRSSAPTPVRIPQALLHYERDICAEDAYLGLGQAGLRHEPCARHDRRSHRAGQRRAGAPQHGL